MHAQREYRPVSCDFHDLLEASATEHRTVQLQVRVIDGDLRTLSARITDIPTRDDGEYALLDRDEEIRLDRIVSIDGAQQSDYAD